MDGSMTNKPQVPCSSSDEAGLSATQDLPQNSPAVCLASYLSQ